MQRHQRAPAIAGNQLISQIEIRKLARTADQIVDHLHGDGARLNRGGCEFFQFRIECLQISADQTNDLSQHAIVGRGLQLFQTRAGPGFCFRSLSRRKLNHGTGAEQRLGQLLALIQIVGDENHTVDGEGYSDSE